MMNIHFANLKNNLVKDRLNLDYNSNTSKLFYSKSLDKTKTKGIIKNKIYIF